MSESNRGGGTSDERVRPGMNHSAGRGLTRSSVVHSIAPASERATGQYWAWKACTRSAVSRCSAAIRRS